MKLVIILDKFYVSEIRGQNMLRRIFRVSWLYACKTRLFGDAKFCILILKARIEFVLEILDAGSFFSLSQGNE